MVVPVRCRNSSHCCRTSAGQALRVKRRRAEEQRIKSARGREKSSDDIFVCERVCTSKRMLKRVGAFSKDPTPDTCVTVCGVSELDACSDALALSVLINTKCPTGMIFASGDVRVNALNSVLLIVLNA
ncbi:hypothetical protein MKW92_022764 [Papaver armeniacum]|nr:hypothetical protein MKW92_022764 [Papaver armeniacum]